MAGDLGAELAAAVRRQIIDRAAAELVEDLAIFRPGRTRENILAAARALDGEASEAGLLQRLAELRADDERRAQERAAADARAAAGAARQRRIETRYSEARGDARSFPDCAAWQAGEARRLLDSDYAAWREATGQHAEQWNGGRGGREFNRANFLRWLDADPAAPARVDAMDLDIDMIRFALGRIL